MSSIVATFRLWLRVAITLAVTQAIVEAFAISFVFRDVALAPARFFPNHVYDAFVQCYLWMAWNSGFPDILDTFVGQGFGPKLSILPALLTTNLLVATVLAVVWAPLHALSRRIRPSSGSGPILALLVGVQLAVHLSVWIATVHFPVDPGLHDIAANTLRNFLHDGTWLSLLILAGAGLLTLPALERPRSAASIALVVLAMVFSLAPSPITTQTGPEHVSAPAASVARGYNVVLVSIDSLRADHLGAYGYQRNTSPTIDALSREGVLFRSTRSTTSWTLPSHMSLLTGRSLLGHGVVADDRRLTSDVPCLAESFSDAGYATGAIVSAPYLESRYGFARGFDEYDDHTIGFATHGASYKEVTAPLLQKTADAWIDRHSGAPFFLFLHYWDVHYDYIPSPPYDTMFDPDYDGEISGENFYFNPEVNPEMDRRDLEHLVALYDGEIRLVDDHLAMLRRSLERRGLADNTVIVVTADHGDEFFEHGHKGHHRTLYEEVLRVPWVVYVPGVEPLRREVTMEASIIDVAPTILGVVGLEIPEGVEGADMSGVSYGSAPQWDRATLSELYRFKTLNVQVSLQRRDTKIIQHFKYRWLRSFDLLHDPSELSPLPQWSPQTTALTERMVSRLNSAWGPFQSRLQESGVSPVEMDVEATERLRSLGYVE